MSALTKSQQKKTDILTLAKSGGKRPSMKEDLGQALNNYTSASSNSFDEEFAVQVRSLRPEWFRVRKAKEPSSVG